MGDIILVAEDRSMVNTGNEVGNLQVVESIDEQGNIKTRKPTPKIPLREMVKMDVNTKGDVLENFVKSFNKSYKNVKNYRLYTMKVEDGNVKKSVDALEAMLQNPTEHKEALKEMRVNPYDYMPEQTVTPEVEALLQGVGLSSQVLQEHDQLDKFLKFQYTDVLYVKTSIDDTEVMHQARIALRNNPDGAPTLDIRSVKKELDLDTPFLGNQFSETDKLNLETYGNLGRLAELKFPNGEAITAFVSVDSQTNNLVFMPTKDVRIPNHIAGVDLTPEQIEQLANGYLVPVQGLQSKKGEPYDAILQYSAEKRGLDFRFPTNKQFLGNRRSDGIPNTICKVPLTVKQQNALSLGKALKIEGMINKNGQTFDSYITWNKNKGKFKFSNFDPTKSKKSEVVQKATDAGIDITKSQTQGKSQKVGESKGIKAGM